MTLSKPSLEALKKLADAEPSPGHLGFEWYVGQEVADWIEALPWMYSFVAEGPGYMKFSHHLLGHPIHVALALDPWEVQLYEKVSVGKMRLEAE